MTKPAERVLKEDEAHCLKCDRLFSSGDSFSEHEGARGRCQEPEKIGLIERSGVWGFAGKDRTKRPRRTPAMAAFDRIIEEMESECPKSHLKKFRESVRTDVDKVLRALERDRDR